MKAYRHSHCARLELRETALDLRDLLDGGTILPPALRIRVEDLARELDAESDAEGVEDPTPAPRLPLRRPFGFLGFAAKDPAS